MPEPLRATKEPFLSLAADHAESGDSHVAFFVAAVVGSLAAHFLFGYFAGEARMSLDGKPLEAPPYPTAQLVVSPVAPDRFYGRAYTGLLCYTPDSPYKAAAYVSPHPVVSMEEDDAGFASWRTGGQLLLAEGAKLTLEGLRQEICAVTDGNPYLLPGGSVTLQYEPDVIRVMKRRQS